jgi:hypothetical protein
LCTPLILVNLLVDSGNVLLVLLPLNSLALHTRVDLLVDSGVVLTGFSHQSFNSGFGGVHCNSCFRCE